MTTIKPSLRYAKRFQSMITDAGLYEHGLVQTASDTYEIDLGDEEAEEEMISDILLAAETWNIPGSEIEIN